jgi:hypothetical protein
MFLEDALTILMIPRLADTVNLRLETSTWRLSTCISALDGVTFAFCLPLLVSISLQLLVSSDPLLCLPALNIWLLVASRFLRYAKR